MFVVFDTEDKLNSHLINKHKVIDTKKKMNDLFFGNGNDNKKKYDLKGKKNEFNFSQYIEELKEREIRPMDLDWLENYSTAWA